MESFFAELYLHIQERLTLLVPDVSWIEQDFSQDDFDEWRASVSFPAVLIDFPATEYSEIAQGNQLADCVVSIRLLADTFSQSYEGAPLEVKKDALSYFDLEKKVVTALQNWQPEGNYCTPLIRKRAVTDNRNNIGLRKREIHFTTSFEEYVE